MRSLCFLLTTSLSLPTVYLVLTFMLALTTGLTAIFVLVDSVKNWTHNNMWAFWTSWFFSVVFCCILLPHCILTLLLFRIVSLVLMFVLFCVRNKRPLNAILLFVWVCLSLSTTLSVLTPSRILSHHQTGIFRYCLYHFFFFPSCFRHALFFLLALLLPLLHLRTTLVLSLKRLV